MKTMYRVIIAKNEELTQASGNTVVEYYDIEEVVVPDDFDDGNFKNKLIRINCRVDDRKYVLVFHPSEEALKYFCDGMLVCGQVHREWDQIFADDSNVVNVKMIKKEDFLREHNHANNI